MQENETWFRKELNELRGKAFAMALIVFATIGCLIGYFLFSENILGPFKHIAYAKNDGSMDVSVETRLPTRARVEYGTTPDYVNRLYFGETYETSHSTRIEGLLPDKTHFVRVVLEDQTGRSHASAFYTVE